MTQSIAGIALAAGAGARLAPITTSIPKALCPVATIPLIDLALRRLASVDAEPAVNVHHHAQQLTEWVQQRARISMEDREALGTAGAIGHLRDWVAGRPTVAINADTWCPGGLEPLVEGWDGDRVRVFVPGGGQFGPRSAIVGTLLPWRVVSRLSAVPSGLYEVAWRDEFEAGRLEVVTHDGPWMDCGTPTQLLEANLAALAGAAVVDPSATVSGSVQVSAISAGAVVRGAVTDSVVFAGATVEVGERLRRAIRWVDPQGQQMTVDG